MNIRKRIGIIFSVAFLISTVGFSQNIPFPNAGIDPAGSYAGKDVYQIDLSLGQLSAQIPIVSYKQIGALQPINYFITISNPVYIQQVTCDSDIDSCFMYYAAADQSVNSYGAQIGMTTESVRLNGAYSILQTLYDDTGLNGGPIPVEAYTDEMQYTAVDGTGHAHQLLYNPNNFDQMYAVDGSGVRYFAPSTDDIADEESPTRWSSSWLPEGTLAEPNGVTSELPNTYNCDCYQGSVINTDLSGNTYTYPIYKWDTAAPTITDAIQRENLPVIPIRQFQPDPSDVSHCPTGPQQALYSTSMELPGYGMIWLCYTRVQYHTGLLIEYRPFNTLDFDGNGKTYVPDNYEWPLIDSILEYTLPTEDPGYINALLEWELNTVGSFDALQAVVLPNGKSWRFAYDTSVSSTSGSSSEAYICGGGVSNDSQESYASTEACGGVMQIDYPDGGYVNFGPGLFQTGLGYMNDDQTADPSQALTDFVTVSTEAQYDGRSQVASNIYKTSVTVNGNQPYGDLIVSTGTVTDVIDTIANTTTRHTFSDLGDTGKLEQLYETQVDYYQGTVSGTPLKTVKTAYQYNMMPDYPTAITGSAINILPKTISTYLNGDLQLATQNTYPFLYNVAPVLCKRGYDPFGALPVPFGCHAIGSYPIYWSIPEKTDIYDGQGSLLRSVRNIPRYISDSTGQYAFENLLNLVGLTQVLDSSGTVTTETSYGYDESNGSPSGIHGNQTSVTTLAGTSQVVYNSNGMPITQIDPLQNHTQITYQCTGAYPRSVTFAAGTANAETINYGYDCTSGRIQSAQGPNDISNGRPGTTYTYNSYGDLTVISYPDGGQALIDYNGYSVPTTVAVTKTATPNPNVTTSIIYDGFSRAIQQQESVGSNTIYSGTVAFDSAGRVRARWNPSSCNPLLVSSCSGETTWGATTYNYDILGRTTMQCNANNGTGGGTCASGSSYQKWSYNGNVTTLSNEAGTQWQYTADALGRLVKVLEPAGNPQQPSMETDYGYDVLNNLLSVTQHGASSSTSLQRSFTYDSLSRLLGAMNPESGTGTYTYDANGNVLTKTDARGITMGYCYDALDRLTAELNIAPDTSSCSSPQVGQVLAAYSYDASSITGAQNTIGRLTGEKSYAGSTLVSERQLYSYDPMGRLLSENQITYKTPSSTNTYSLAYRYDLAGNLIASTDGSKPVSSPSTQFPCTPPSDVQSWTTLVFVNCYDGAGRTSSVTSNWTAYPANLFTAGSTNGYYPAGQLWNWTQGTASSSTPALSVTQTYTNRLWLNAITATGQVP